MRLRSIALLLCGSLATYVAVACSNVSDSPADMARDSGVDALIDALTDGPTDAKADDASTPRPTIDVVACDKPVPSTSGYYAEKSFPGRTKEDLARATALECGPKATFLADYSCASSGIAVRDGFIAAACPSAALTVTFVVPPPI